MDHAADQKDPDWIKPYGTPGLVSFVVPTCNRVTLLVETLGSIVEQTYRPIQIVVVDDDSRDNTAVRVSEIQTQATESLEIIYLRQSKAGAPAARNRGARKTTGEFIVFMDDDDVISTNFLQSHIESLRAQTHADFSWCRWRRFQRDESHYLMLENKGEMPPLAGSAWEAFLMGWELLLQGCVVRRSLVSTVGPWNLSLKKSQDLEYKARLLAANEHLTEAPDAKVFYRLHKASISGVLDDAKLVSYMEALEEVERLAEARSDYVQLQPILADYLWRHSFTLYTRGCLNEGLKALKQARRHDTAVAFRNGPKLSRLLARVGLDRMSGPLLLKLFRWKTWLMGRKSLPVQERALELPR